MARLGITIAVLLALLLAVSSCRPIERVEGAKVETVLTTETLPFKDAIPRDYGRFVGVLQSPLADARAILWFEKPDSTIAAIWVDYTEGLGEKVLLIPRK